MLFYGTPAFALPTLEGLLAHHQVVAVITQPDKPAGRGRALTPSPVKRRALEAAVPVLQPPRLRDPGWPERLAYYRPDVAVVAAFGQILPKTVLDVPTHGSINVHGSLLPRYRGAAPIAWAIMRGETETGITTFQMDAGMDTGDMLLQEATAIGPDETAGELSVRLAEIGARLLLRTLDGLESLPRIPQDSTRATLAPRLKKEDGPDLLLQGSGDLIQTLLANDLIDEFRLMIFPIILGPGKRLFGKGAIPVGLRLIESKVSSTGVTMNKYVRAGEVIHGHSVHRPTRRQQQTQQ